MPSAAQNRRGCSPARQTIEQQRDRFGARHRVEERIGDELEAGQLLLRERHLFAQLVLPLCGVAGERLRRVAIGQVVHDHREGGAAGVHQAAELHVDVEDRSVEALMHAAPLHGSLGARAIEQRLQLAGVERRVEEARGAGADRLRRAAEIQPRRARPPVADGPLAGQHDCRVAARRALQIVECLADDPVLAHRRPEIPHFGVRLGEPPGRLLFPRADVNEKAGDQHRLGEEADRGHQSGVGDHARRQHRRQSGEERRPQSTGQRRAGNREVEQRERGRRAGGAEHHLQSDGGGDEQQRDRVAAKPAPLGRVEPIDQPEHPLEARRHTERSFLHSPRI
jgi:hypothetical protein